MGGEGELLGVAGGMESAQRSHTMTDPLFVAWLERHAAEFLDLRMSGIGFDLAMQEMKKRFEKEKEERDVSIRS